MSDLAFNEVMRLVRARSAELLLTDDEAWAMYNFLMTLPPRSTIVEIGSHWGRSTALIAQIAKVYGHRLTCIDPFTGYPDIAGSWMEMMVKLECPFTLHCKRSSEAVDARGDMDIDMLYIDGDHEYNGVLSDCEQWAQRIRPNGYMLVHDYGRPGLDGVKAAVDHYHRTNGYTYTPLGTHGTLGIWRREPSAYTGHL